MSLVIGMLLLWVLLFGPLGALVHKLALGDVAERQAFVIAPVTGMAIAVVVFPISWALAGTPAPVFVAGILALVVWIFGAWKLGWIAYTPRLAWAVLLGIVVAAVAGSAIDPQAQGPAGYGTGSEPVAEVHAITALMDGAAPPDYPGFASLAAAMSWIGDEQWEPYRLHATITLPLLALLALPLMLYAERRGIGRLGTAMLMAIGIATPPLMVAIAMGQPGMVLAALFATGGIVGLLLGRRDRGWLAVAMIHLGALLAVGGPGALLAPALVAAAWLLLRRGRAEHKPASEKPVSVQRSLVAGAVAGMVALVVAAPGIGSLAGMPWRAMADNVVDAAMMWPFVWLDEARTVAVPDQVPDIGFWLVGMLLLAIVVIYAIQHSDRRELAVVVGVGAVVPAAVLVYGANPTTSQQLIESGLVLCSPLLAGVVVRALGIARARAAEVSASSLPGAVPALLVGTVAVLSLATASTTGARIVQAPVGSDLASRVGDAGPNSWYVAAADPWIAHLAGDGAHSDASGRDLDQLPTRGEDSLMYGNWAGVIREADPFASDPPGRFVPDPAFSSFGVDVFTLTAQPKAEGLADDAGEASDPGSASGGTDGTDAPAPNEIKNLDDVLAAADAKQPTAPAVTGPARFHLPAEPPGEAGPGGLLVPTDGVRPTPVDHPVRHVGCPADAALIGRQPGAGADEATPADGPGTAEGPALAPVPAREVESLDAAELCMEVVVPDANADVLTMRIQTIGIVLDPSLDASVDPNKFRQIEIDGQPAFESTEPDAEISFASAALIDHYAVFVEGGPGSQLELVEPLRAGVSMAGGYGGWVSHPERAELDGDITIRALSDGARISRVVATPVKDIPASFDAVVQLKRDSVWSYPGGSAVPEISTAVIGIGEDGAGDRVATIRVRTSAGIGFGSEPYQLMVDWFEGYAGSLRDS